MCEREKHERENERENESERFSLLLLTGRRSAMPKRGGRSCQELGKM